MAFEKRTIEEIENAMILDKESRPELDVLDSTSNIAVWRNMIYAFATAASLHEGAFADFESSVESRSFEVIAGTDKWYASESLKFQFGDQLMIINDVITYEVIDEEKQIIKLSAADKEGGRLILKVAKLDDNGNAFPLTSTEIASFQEYWNQKRFACIPIAFRSQPGDIGIFDYRIGVDSSVLDPSNGESVDEPGVFPVHDAIIQYIQSYQSENFSGLFRVMKLTDAIQSVLGVENVVVQDVQIKAFNGNFTNVTNQENQEYNSRSGYIVVDPDNPLEDTLTFY